MQKRIVDDGSSSAVIEVLLNLQTVVIVGIVLVAVLVLLL